VSPTAAWLLTRRLDPPLTPDADEARSLLRRELARPEYNAQNLVERFLNWIGRSFDRSVGAASESSPVSTLSTMVIVVALALALAWLLSRARRTSRVRPDEEPLLEAGVDAAELRRRAEAAFTREDYATAVLDGFRATAAAQVESGRITEAPGATAREMVVALAAEFPHAVSDLEVGGRLFDEVAYGHRPATAEQARAVLGLDARLVVRR
jgi:hypothetical protein